MGSRWAWSVRLAAAAGCALTLALGLVGCAGGNQLIVSGSPAAFLRRAITATGAQSRMVIRLTGGSVRRAVIDTKAQYRALFSARKLIVLDRHGIEYRDANGCYRSSRADRLRSEGLWAGVVDDVTSRRYSTDVSGTSVTYRSAQGEMTIDAGTGLIRSARAAGLPAGGVAATTVTFFYPGSVRELPAPTPLCR